MPPRRERASAKSSKVRSRVASRGKPCGPAATTPADSRNAPAPDPVRTVAPRPITPLDRATRALLEAEQLEYETIDEGYRVRVILGDDQPPLHAYLLPHGTRIVCYVIGQEAAPQATRPAMAELLTRINYGLIHGNFEMDYDDGEIRMKASLDVRSTPLDAPATAVDPDEQIPSNVTVGMHLLAALFYPTLFAMVHYIPAVREVAAGRSVLEALAALDRTPSS